MVRNRNQPINILLAEDNPGDAYLIGAALAKSQISYKVHNVLNGEAVMAFLQQEREYRDAPRPDLILLDLNLPLKHGFEVLKEIKSSPDLQMIPTIILTSSSSETDILKSYSLFANCYLIKPADFNEFCDQIEALENFWLKFVQLPPTKPTTI